MKKPYIDRERCVGCSLCVENCPVDCLTIEDPDFHGDINTAAVLTLPEKCIGCKICEKACPNGAIKVDGNVASINYELCDGCGLCESKCPRKIIWSARSQSEEGVIRFKQDLTTV